MEHLVAIRSKLVDVQERSYPRFQVSPVRITSYGVSMILRLLACEFYGADDRGEAFEGVFIGPVMNRLLQRVDLSIRGIRY
jgi:hypothetical protein